MDSDTQKKKIVINKKTTDLENSSDFLPTYPVLFSEEVVQTPTIEKKKRGRKPKVKDPDEPPKIPKKRGRKPKVLTDENLLDGKNNKNTYSLIDSNNTITATACSQTYIITLKINSDEVRAILGEERKTPWEQQLENEPMTIDPMEKFGRVPQLNITDELSDYLENHFNYMYNFSQGQIPVNHKIVMPTITPETVDFSLASRASMPVESSIDGLNISTTSNMTKSLHQFDLSSQMSGKWINRRVDYILPAFKDNENSWPQHSPYACWNCAENFSGPPIGIPDHISGSIDSMDIDDMKFYLYGNFCDFPCAARYLFDTVKDSTVWEQYSNLNILYTRAYHLSNLSKVELAPEKILLKKFGGYLNIDEYRKSHLSNKEYSVFKPPMIPILYQMEETILDTQEPRDNRNVPMDTEKVDRKLKLQRMKPIQGNTMTIDKIMKMHVKVS